MRVQLGMPCATSLLSRPGAIIHTPGMADSSLELALQFAPLARRPDVRRLGRRWDVCIEVDGVLSVFKEGPRHVMPISAGPHEVVVWFRGAGIAILGRWSRFGLRRLQVVAEPGTPLRLVYEGSTFWHMGGDSALRLA